MGDNNHWNTGFTRDQVWINRMNIYRMIAINLLYVIPLSIIFNSFLVAFDYMDYSQQFRALLFSVVLSLVGMTLLAGYFRLIFYLWKKK